MTGLLIIMGILFILDVYLSLVRPLSKWDDVKGMVFSIIRLLYVWLILLTLFIINIDLKNKAQGKCPELEKVENVYKNK